MRAADYWDQAMDAERYLAQMSEKRDIFERRIRQTKITDVECRAFSQEPLRFLVLTEDFCTDSAQFIPPLIRLAEEIDSVDVRLLLRDQHHDLAGNYPRRDGYPAIPIVIVLDEAGNELGHLVERPGRVYDELAAETRRFARGNPHLPDVKRTYDRMPPETKAAVKANSERFRDGQLELWTRWLFEDLRAMIDAGIQRRDEPAQS